MGSKEKLKKAVETRRKADDGRPDDPTAPQTLDMEIVKKPVEFCQVYLKFNPTPYQVKLLNDESKRIYVCWSRQSGKSTTLAARMIQRCLQFPGTLRLIVAPGLRQSMIMMDKIQDFIYNIPKAVRREVIGKVQRTTIRFKNGSRIVALPNSPNLLRGYSASEVLCFPAQVRVTLAEGGEIPICEMKPGQTVLSYNVHTDRVESRPVLRVFKRMHTGPLLRIVHNSGEVECTPDHQFYTPLGKVAACNLTNHHRLVRVQLAAEQTSDADAGAISLRWSVRRFFSLKAEKESKKLDTSNKPFCQASRVCDVQVQSAEGFHENLTKTFEKRWLGRTTTPLCDPRISSIHSGARDLLREWQENDQSPMAVKDHPPLGLGGLVYGRWQSAKKQWKHEDCDKLIHAGRAYPPASLATRKMEYQHGCSTGPTREGLLLGLSSERTRQIPRFGQTLHSPEHDLQGSYCRSSETELPSLSLEVCSAKEYLQGDDETRISPLLLSEVSQLRHIEAQIQSPTHAMQDMRANLHTAHRQATYLQQVMQPPKQVEEETRERMAATTWPEILVYNIEVENNHNYFANGVLVANCDEAAFFREDELIFFNVLYPMLQTTDGSLITSSTPWGKNTVFYKFSQNPDFSKHHITWEDVVKAHLAKPEFIEEMRRSMPTDRFRREFEAEFTEDETAYLPQDLITRCIDPDASFIPDSFFGF